MARNHTSDLFLARLKVREGRKTRVERREREGGGLGRKEDEILIVLTESAVQRLRSRLTGCTRCRRTRARGPSARIAQRSIAYARETRRSGSNLGRERGRGRAAERGGRKGETTSCPMDDSAACLFVRRSLRPTTGPSTSTVHCTALAERHSTKRGKAISGRKRRNASFPPPPTTTTDDGDVGQRENGREQKDPLGRGGGGGERRGGERKEYEQEGTAFKALAADIIIGRERGGDAVRVRPS